MSVVRDLRFAELIKSKPMPGDILQSVDEDYVKVRFDKVRRKNGSMLELAYVNCAVDPEALGWYLSHEDRGLKALILPVSQSLLRSYYRNEDIKVKRLSVVRINDKHSALYCEVLPDDFV